METGCEYIKTKDCSATTDITICVSTTTTTAKDTNNKSGFTIGEPVYCFDIFKITTVIVYTN